MRLKWLLVVFFTAFLITACSTTAQQTNSPAVQAAIDQVELEPGTAALVGQVATTASGEPVLMPEVVVRLATVIWNDTEKTDGTFVLEGGSSPGDYADELGVFVFEDIAPGDYILVVGDVIGTHEIVSNPDGSARIFTADQGKITNIGVIKVSIE
jgi:hypothetical protein